VKSTLALYEQQYIYVYVYKSNNDISKIISKRWKNLTTRQEISSGSATRTPSLPYSTPRAPNSRVFFTMSTSSLMAEKTLHTNYHTTTSSHLFHNFYTTTSQLLHNNFTTSSHLITLLLFHTYTTCTPQSIHNFSTYTPY
jgi:hypothetical protein